MGKIAITVTTPAAWAFTVNNWSMPFFNVPMTVVATAALGSLLSYAWGEREEDKGKLYLTALASTFLGVICVTVLPRMMGWDWVDEPSQAPLAGFIAIACRHAAPHTLSLLPEILRKLFRLDATGDSRSSFTRSKADATNKTKEKD